MEREMAMETMAMEIMGMETWVGVVTFPIMMVLTEPSPILECRIWATETRYWGSRHLYDRAFKTINRAYGVQL